MIDEITKVDTDKIETRGRKPINTDGTKRTGRYIRCLHCEKSFYWQHTNPNCKATPKKNPKKKKEPKREYKSDDSDTEIGLTNQSEQDKIDYLLTQGWV